MATSKRIFFFSLLVSSLIVFHHKTYAQQATCNVLVDSNQPTNWTLTGPGVNITESQKTYVQYSLPVAQYNISGFSNLSGFYNPPTTYTYPTGQTGTTETCVNPGDTIEFVIVYNYINPPPQDTEPPQITGFNVNPTASDNTVTVSVDAVDTGGSHLAFAEFWRANYNNANCSGTGNTGGCSWTEVGIATAPTDANGNYISDGPWTGSVTDNPGTGLYFYGVHVKDGQQALNCSADIPQCRTTEPEPIFANIRLGTVTVQSNIPTSWHLDGPAPDGNWVMTPIDGTDGTTPVSYWPTEVGNYTISQVPTQVVFNGNFYNLVNIGGGTTQTLDVGQNIVFNIIYSQGLFPPSNLTADNSTCQKINLSWTNSSSSNNGFNIYRGTASGQETLLDSVGPNVTTYTDSSVVANTTYYYYVTTFTNSPQMESVPSNETPGTVVLSCKANFSNSSFVVTQVTSKGVTSPYNSSMQLYNGDILTCQITIVNTGPSTAHVNYLTDTASSNLVNLANVNVDAPGAIYSGMSGSLPKVQFNLVGTKGVGNPDWVVTFQITINLTKATEILTQQADINYTDSTGTYNQLVNMPSIIISGKSAPPFFKEISP